MTIEEIINKLNISIGILDNAIEIPDKLSRIRAAYSNINITLGELLASDDAIAYAVFTIINTLRHYRSPNMIDELMRIRTAMTAILHLLEPLANRTAIVKEPTGLKEDLGLE